MHAANIRLADEPTDGLTAGHRDDLDVLTRRVAVGEVDVVIPRDDPAGDALRLDPVAQRANRLASAKRRHDHDDDNKCDRDGAKGTHAPAGGWLGPFG